MHMGVENLTEQRAAQRLATCPREFRQPFSEADRLPPRELFPSFLASKRRALPAYTRAADR
jgi:hypothetical protein